MFIGTMFQSLSLHEDRAELHFNHVACCPYLSPHDLFKDRVSINGYHMLHPSLELTHAHQWGVAQVFGEENWERHVSWRRHIPDFVVWWANPLLPALEAQSHFPLKQPGPEVPCQSSPAACKCWPGTGRRCFSCA